MGVDVWGREDEIFLCDSGIFLESALDMGAITTMFGG
jgi:hypothetical protein